MSFNFTCGKKEKRELFGQGGDSFHIDVSSLKGTNIKDGFDIKIGVIPHMLLALETVNLIDMGLSSIPNRIIISTDIGRIILKTLSNVIGITLN